MNYQVLVLDLDGTLTNSQKKIPSKTREALIDIQKNGKKVVLASGRPTRGVLPLAEELQLAKYGSYVLSFNGARITDCRTGQIIYNRSLPSDALPDIYSTVLLFREEGLDILTYTEEEIISGIRPNSYTMLESRINHMPVRVSTSFVEDVPRQLCKCLATGEPDAIARLKEKMEAVFRSYISVYCSDPFFLEIMPRGVDKAHSLLKLISSIGLGPEQMICCGDGYNDITMIEAAGLGVAMANAQPPVRARADYITKSNDEDGVLHVINTFMR